jgi:transketolase
MFVLSKGHAVASAASIFADLGYFDSSVLKNSRSIESILNGHPGPILPGFPISTGPLGQGIGVAEGFALIGRENPKFNVYCMMGDGELQEGIVWEAFMYSAYKKLDNLCVIVDKNYGQLDTHTQLVFPMTQLKDKFESFGWQVIEADGTKYESVIMALETFKNRGSNGQPMAIICPTTKGFGGFSSFMNKHKVVIPDDLMKQEMDLQNEQRKRRIAEFVSFYESAEAQLQKKLIALARRMHLNLNIQNNKIHNIKPEKMKVLTKKAPKRLKKVTYTAAELPIIVKGEQYSAATVISETMKIFSRNPHIVSIDADLSSTSGLEAGVGFVDKQRAHNVGVAEANMMNLGEAYAAMGYNTWVSTFCPFFDWKVLRRIAVGQQERLEAITDQDSWLNEGHGLDLTFIATAPNFETQTNGATHMGNDDITIFKGLAQLKIIDVSCPNQLLGIMKWIAEGDKGLIYMRVMRAPSGVIYDSDFKFIFGKAYILKQNDTDQAVILSSGRAVHEALAAADELDKSGINICVIDMPSVDENMILHLVDRKIPILVAEQNNGYIWEAMMKVLFINRKNINTEKIIAINTLDANQQPQFIHSGTYAQLAEKFGLSSRQLVDRIHKII